MARKLKKSALSGIKEKHIANEQSNVEKIKQATELFDNAKKLMDMGMAADAIGIFENLLAAKMPLNAAQQQAMREMLTYFVERSMKRMVDYPCILEFMGVKRS